MKKAVFNTENIEPKCEYCQFGKLSADGETVLCIKRGIMNKNSKCRKYVYDIMKRVPRKAPKMQSFSEEDFSLD